MVKKRISHTNSVQTCKELGIAFGGTTIRGFYATKRDRNSSALFAYGAAASTAPAAAHAQNCNSAGGAATAGARSGKILAEWCRWLLGRGSARSRTNRLTAIGTASASLAHSFVCSIACSFFMSFIRGSVRLLVSDHFCLSRLLVVYG